jgi:hypothetical protein
VNFILPKKIANDLWRAGDPAWSEPGLRPRGVSPLLHWWWTAWVLGYVASTVAEKLYSDADSISEIRSGVIAYIVSDALWIVAAALAWFIVKNVTQRLESLPPPLPGPAQT